MRYWIAILLLIPLLSVAQEHNHNHSEDQNPFEQSSEYVCPMHSQVVRTSREPAQFVGWI